MLGLFFRDIGLLITATTGEWSEAPSHIPAREYISSTETAFVDSKYTVIEPQWQWNVGVEVAQNFHPFLTAHVYISRPRALESLSQSTCLPF